MLMVNLLCLLSLALAVNTNLITRSGKEGQVCSKVRGELWKCTRASECSVYPKLRTSKYLSICSKVGSEGEDVVCCPKSARVAKRESISEQKCQEYQRNICINNQPSLVHSSLQDGSIEEFMEEKPEEGWVIPDVGIFGGTQVLPGEFPHSALIGYGEENNILWSCGGTLISERYVLSAAHCVQSENGPAQWVLLGDVDYTTDSEEGAQRFQIVDRVQHELYSGTTFYNDVALLRLDRDAVFTRYVAPACLYPGHSNPPGQAIALGWGITGPNKGPSEAMMKVFLDFVSAESCGKVMLPKANNKMPNGVMDSHIICAFKKNKTMCSGDSGSGIVLADKGDECLYRLAGVMSFTLNGCFVHNVPSAFMRVAPYIQWIEDVVWR